jgi:3,4-dihydroxy 2-butanone 4-phosphate synthase/GTP cyclohydrolase II
VTLTAEPRLTGVAEVLPVLAAGGVVAVGGALVAAASLVTPAVLRSMSGGLLCCAVDRDRLDRLRIPPMPGDRPDLPLHVGVDHAAGDRVATIRTLADPTAAHSDFRLPGRVFPLGADPLGVLGRPGIAEAAVDLVRLAGLPAAAAVCEMDGVPTGLPSVTVQDVITHRRRHEPVVERVADTILPLPEGRFRALGYRNRLTGREHVALVHGDVTAHDGVPALLHTECRLGDLFGARCECRRQLHDALRAVVAAGAGVVVYLRADDAEADGTDIVRELGLREPRVEVAASHPQYLR